MTGSRIRSQRDRTRTVARMESNLLSVVTDILSSARTILSRYGAIVVGSAIAYPILAAIYNAFLHPLRNYPGPKLMAMSTIPVYWYRVRGHGTKIVASLHDEYGPVVRLSPTELSFNDPQAWKDIYGHRSHGKKSFQKDPVQLGPDMAGVDGIIRADDANHARQRRTFAHAFSDKALKAQEPLIARYVQMLMQAIQSQNDDDARGKADIDAVKMYNFTTFDVMGDLTFGEPLHMLRDGEYVPWVEMIFQGVKFISFGHAIRRFTVLSWLLPYLMPKHLAEKRQRHFKFSTDRVDRRLEKDQDRPDIWNLVMKNTGGEGLATAEMYSNASTFMVAGTETTATLLSGLTWLLCKNPVQMERLVEEIRAFKSPRDLNITNLQGLKYLQACLEEGLRVYPAAPSTTMRLVPEGGAEVCGKAVPEGVTVGIPHHACYRSSENFKDANEFHPERWLSGPEGAPYSGDNKAIFQPFSFGPRNCLGKNLAYHEMRLILSSMLWHFDISLVDNSTVWTDQKDYGLWEKTPLWINATPVVRD